MNKKPSLEDLGLDAPASPPPVKKSWQDIANEVDDQPAATATCPYCGSKMSPNASKCSSCQEWIKKPQAGWNGIGAVLSFFVPGLGQLYRGNILSGIVLFVVTLPAYVMLLPLGLVLHLIAIIDAGVRGK